MLIGQIALNRVIDDKDQSTPIPAKPVIFKRKVTKRQSTQLIQEEKIADVPKLNGKNSTLDKNPTPLFYQKESAPLVPKKDPH